MSEVAEPTTPPAEELEVTTPPPSEALKPEKPEPGPVPYSRFQEVNEKLKKLEEAEAQRVKDEAAATRRRQLEEGKHEEIIQTQTKELEKLRPVKEQAERYKGALEQYLAEERKGVPKHVIPLLDKLDVVDQLEYIAANRQEFAKPTPPNLNSRERGGDGTDSRTDEERQAELERRFPALRR